MILIFLSKPLLKYVLLMITIIIAEKQTYYIRILIRADISLTAIITFQFP